MSKISEWKCNTYVYVCVEGMSYNSFLLICSILSIKSLFSVHPLHSPPRSLSIFFKSFTLSVLKSTVFRSICCSVNGYEMIYWD